MTIMLVAYFAYLTYVLNEYFSYQLKSTKCRIITVFLIFLLGYTFNSVFHLWMGLYRPMLICNQEIRWVVSAYMDYFLKNIAVLVILCYHKKEFKSRIPPPSLKKKSFISSYSVDTDLAEIESVITQELTQQTICQTEKNNRLSVSLGLFDRIVEVNGVLIDEEKL